MSNPASLGGTQIKSWNIYQKERSRAAGETSGAEGDADCGGELLDAGLEGGSGALVEGNLLGGRAHQGPGATAVGSGQPGRRGPPGPGGPAESG